jgi:flagellar biosynthesis protein FliP
MPKFLRRPMKSPATREARPRRKRRGRDDHSVKSVLFSFGVMQVERGLRSGVMMMFGLLVVVVREVSVMAGLLMVTFFVMVLRFAMMLGGLFVVLGGVRAVFACSMAASPYGREP